jgi:Tannase-like family of unknown function (DUF6351)
VIWEGPVPLIGQTDYTVLGLHAMDPDETVCSLINPIFTTPRVVAGEGIETDINKCSLKPLRRSDYLPVVFTDAQWAQLRAAFGTGVCDWSRPGVDQQATIPWMTYEDMVGGWPLGSPPSSSSGYSRSVIDSS